MIVDFYFLYGAIMLQQCYLIVGKCKPNFSITCTGMWSLARLVQALFHNGRDVLMKPYLSVFAGGEKQLIKAFLPDIRKIGRLLVVD